MATPSERHLENEGGQLARKYMRAALGRLVRKGEVNRCTAELIEAELDATVERSAKRAGGLGRK